MEDNEMMVQENENEEVVYDYYDDDYEDEIEGSSGLGKLILGIAIGGVAAVCAPKVWKKIKNKIEQRRQSKNQEVFVEISEDGVTAVESSDDDSEEE